MEADPAGDGEAADLGTVGGDASRAGAVAAVAVLAVFNAFWRLGAADWRTDEVLDGAAAWRAVGGDWSVEDGHPVFVRWFLGAGQVLFGQTRLGVRFFPAVVSLCLTATLFFLGRQLVGFWVGVLAAGIWGVVPRPILVGWQELFVVRPDRYAYLEPYAAWFLLLAVWSGWSWIRTGRWWPAVATGLLAGVGMACKPTVAVALPAIVLAAFVARRRPGRVAAQAATIGATSVLVLVASYLPMGTAGPGALWRLLEFQRNHVDFGHPVVLGSTRTLKQGWWTNAWFQWNGTGAVVTTVLLGGAVVALTSRHRAFAAYLYAVLLTTFVGHALSDVALPHYHLLWFPLLALLAAIGIVDALEDGRRPLAVAGALALAVLVVAAGSGATRIAGLRQGDIARTARQVAAAGVHPNFIVYAGEPIGPFFPDAQATALGFNDTARPADLMVLDLGYAQYLDDGRVEAFRRRALTLGLRYHRTGDVEAWYR